ncbi:hypothetical protein NDI39_09990 [Microcoleus sp. ZQ-A2]|nr:hypothetical protein [Microcoleus sp. FACHB-1]
MGLSIYGKRDLVAVRAVPNANWLYGFRTNYKKADAATELGHQPGFGATGLNPAMVLGCNAPKPSRVTKPRGSGGTDGLLAGGNESTFCDVANLDEAQKGGWSIAKLYKRVTGRKGLFFVELALVNPQTAEDGSATSGIVINYAWAMPAFLQAKITAADKTALGITESTGSTNNLVRGLRYPQPPRATFKAVGTESVGSRTTFVATSKTDTLPNGWRVVS